MNGVVFGQQCKYTEQCQWTAEIWKCTEPTGNGKVSDICLQDKKKKTQTIRTSKETLLGSQMRMKLCGVLYIYITKEYITIHITKEFLCNS